MKDISDEEKEFAKIWIRSGSRLKISLYKRDQAILLFRIHGNECRDLANEDVKTNKIRSDRL